MNNRNYKQVKTCVGGMVFPVIKGSHSWMSGLKILGISIKVKLRIPVPVIFDSVGQCLSPIHSQNASIV